MEFFDTRRRSVGFSAAYRQPRRASLSRQRGVAFMMVAVLALGLMSLSLISLQTTLRGRSAQETADDHFLARELAESAAAQALARIKEAGQTTPNSGGGATAQWENFYGGQFIYVVPHRDLVVVSTNDWRGASADIGVATLTRAVLDVIVDQVVPAAR